MPQGPHLCPRLPRALVGKGSPQVTGTSLLLLPPHREPDAVTEDRGLPFLCVFARGLIRGSQSL